MERNIPKTGEIYKHFKNKMYQIVTIATHSETGEKLVIYQALYGDYSCCARPLDMFMSEVDREKYKDVEQKYRFELVDRDSLEKIHIEENNNSMKISTKEVNETRNDSNINHVSTSINSENSINTNNDTNVNTNSEDVYDEEKINPDLLAFLEADTYETKRALLVAMRDRIDDSLINAMAASLDVSIDEGDLDKRFMHLLNSVSIMEKYEVVNRLR